MELEGWLILIIGLLVWNVVIDLPAVFLLERKGRSMGAFPRSLILWVVLTMVIGAIFMLFQSFLGIIALFIWGKLVDLLNIQEALLVVCGGPLLAACFWLSQVYIGSEWHDLSTRERLLAYACFAVVALTTFVSVTLPGEWVDEVPWILAVGAAIMPVFCLLAVWAEPVATVH